MKLFSEVILANGFKKACISIYPLRCFLRPLNGSRKLEGIERSGSERMHFHLRGMIRFDLLLIDIGSQVFSRKDKQDE